MRAFTLANSVFPSVISIADPIATLMPGRADTLSTDHATAQSMADHENGAVSFGMVTLGTLGRERSTFYLEGGHDLQKDVPGAEIAQLIHDYLGR